MIIIPIKTTCVVANCTRVVANSNCIAGTRRKRESIGTLSSASSATKQKKTAAKKSGKVSRRPIFGSSSLHAAPFQSSK